MTLTSRWTLTKLLLVVTTMAITAYSVSVGGSVDISSRATFNDGPTYLIIKGWQSDTEAAKLEGVRQGLNNDSKNYIVVNTLTANSQTKNKKIISRVIKGTKGELYIVAGSRGSSESAQAIAELSDSDKKRIKGWINFAPAHYGSPLADIWTQWWRVPGTFFVAALNEWGKISNIYEMRRKVSKKRFSKIVHLLRDIPTVVIVTQRNDCEGMTFGRAWGCRQLIKTGHLHDGVLFVIDQFIPHARHIVKYNTAHMLRVEEQYDALNEALAVLEE